MFWVYYSGMEHRAGNTVDVFGKALAEAQFRLAEIERRYADLAKEREQLKAIVASLNVYVPNTEIEGTPVAPPSAPNQAQDHVAKAPPPAWKLVEEEFLEAGNTPMSVVQLAARLKTKGWNINSKTISVALVRKTDLFVAAEDYGKHRLRVFPTDEQVGTAMDWRN